MVDALSPQWPTRRVRPAADPGPDSRVALRPLGMARRWIGVACSREDSGLGLWRRRAVGHCGGADRGRAGLARCVGMPMGAGLEIIAAQSLVPLSAAEADVPSLAFEGRRLSKAGPCGGTYFRAPWSHSSETSAVFAVRTVSSTLSELPVRLPCATGTRPAASQARTRSIVLAELTPLR